MFLVQLLGISCDEAEQWIDKRRNEDCEWKGVLDKFDEVCNILGTELLDEYRSREEGSELNRRSVEWEYYHGDLS